MPTRIACLIAILCPSILFADGQDDEPRLTVTVEIDGQSFDAVLDDSVTATLDGKQRLVTLKSHPTRTFRKAGIEFEYPSAFRYTVEREKPGEVAFMFEKSETMLGIHVYENGRAHPIPETIAKWKRDMTALGEDGKTVATELKTPTGAIRGERYELKIGSLHVRHDLFVFPVKGSTVAMVVRESLSDGREAPEAVELRKLLQTTLKVDSSNAVKRSSSPQ